MAGAPGVVLPPSEAPGATVSGAICFVLVGVLEAELLLFEVGALLLSSLTYSPITFTDSCLPPIFTLLLPPLVAPGATASSAVGFVGVGSRKLEL